MKQFVNRKGEVVRFVPSGKPGGFWATVDGKPYDPMRMVDAATK
jgi:hypothetical protein